MRTLPRVDFPDPLGPMRAWVSPRPISSDTPRRIGTPPAEAWRSSITSSGESGIGVGGYGGSGWYPRAFLSRQHAACSPLRRGCRLQAASWMAYGRGRLTRAGFRMSLRSFRARTERLQLGETVSGFFGGAERKAPFLVVSLDLLRCGVPGIVRRLAGKIPPEVCLGRPNDHITHHTESERTRVALGVFGGLASAGDAEWDVTVWPEGDV